MRTRALLRHGAPACLLLVAAWLGGCATHSARSQPAASAAAVAADKAASVPATTAAAPAPPPLDARVFLALPPPAGSTDAREDLAHVRAFQAAATPERRAQAIADNEIDPWKAFAAPLGRRFEAQQLPTAARLFDHVLKTVLAAGTAKKHYGRPRPFVADPTLPMLLPEQRLQLEASYSYPSGHSTYGWTMALLLAELLPERAEAILRRGREYGESRIVCGVHYPSDVEAGRLLGAGLVARLHADPAFVAALDASRRELLAATASP
jgi:acid phosphatase (class A)